MLAALEALLEIESGEEGLMLERLEPMMSDNVEPPWNAWLIGFYSGLASKAGHTKKAKRAAERAIGAMHEVWGEKNLALATPLTVLGEAELMDGNPELAVKYLELALSLRQDSDPMYKAETEFALARALSHTSDTAEYARLMGENALVHYADSGPRRAAERVEVEAWLAKLNAP